MPDDLSSRARGCLMGHAVGDALGGPTEGKSPEAIKRQFGTVTGFLNRQQTGSDDTDYALFNARLLLMHGVRIDASVIADAWINDIILRSNQHRGAGFSEMMAIRNLKSGLRPPASGQHLHSWSDGLAMRVAPFGIVSPGRPDRAAELARMDGMVTHAGEGIYAGQAVAAAIAVAMAGGSLSAVLDAGCEAAPFDSWTKREIRRAVEIGTKCKDVRSALGPLYTQCVFDQYFWSDMAPEAVALAFGVVAASHGDFRDAVIGGVNIGRDTDTIAAIAGAVLGAHRGIAALPEEWTNQVRVSPGLCLGVVKGMDILNTAEDLVRLARHGQEER